MIPAYLVVMLAAAVSGGQEPINLRTARPIVPPEFISEPMTLQKIDEGGIKGYSFRSFSPEGANRREIAGFVHGIWTVRGAISKRYLVNNMLIEEVVHYRADHKGYRITERRYFFLPGGERSNEAPIPISVERLSPEDFDLEGDDLGGGGGVGAVPSGFDATAEETSSAVAGETLISLRRSSGEDRATVDNTKEEVDDIAAADIELMKETPKSTTSADIDATTTTVQTDQES